MPKRDAIDLRTRQRIAAYLRREWERYIRNNADGTQRSFAQQLGLDEGTVSKILANKMDGGFDVGLALIRRLHLDAEYVLNHDPPSKYFEAIRTSSRTARKNNPFSDSGESPDP